MAWFLAGIFFEFNDVFIILISSWWTDNEDWGDQFEHYYRQIEDKLAEFEVCDGATEQLSLLCERELRSVGSQAQRTRRAPASTGARKARKAIRDHH